jgi:hypothetical protein
MDMDQAGFTEAIERFSQIIEQGRQLSTEEYLEIGRLWNTVAHYPALQSSPEGGRYYALVRDKVEPQMVQALHMVVSRGYAFYSQEYDFTLGGILPERNRYRIKELEPGPK